MQYTQNVTSHIVEGKRQQLENRFKELALAISTHSHYINCCNLKNRISGANFHF